MRKLWLLALVAALFMAPEALAQPGGQGQLYYSVSLQDLQNMLSSAGYRYQMKYSRSGRPRILIYMRVPQLNKTYKVVLIPFSRDSQGRWRHLQLYAGFRRRNPPSVQDINNWNRRKRFGRAYIDRSNDPVVETDFLLSGGVSQRNILSYLKLFRIVVAQFVNHIDRGQQQQAPPPPPPSGDQQPFGGDQPGDPGPQEGPGAPPGQLPPPPPSPGEQRGY